MTVSKTVIRNVAVGFAIISISSGCANQGFHLTSNSNLSSNGMQHIVLRPSYSEKVQAKISPSTKLDFENGFLQISNLTARVIGKEDGSSPDCEYYYLDAKVTKYRPGSPIGRFLLTPVVCFGLWGSYVNVDYALYTPSNDLPIGEGVIRKANLWGGAVGRSITAETQIRLCPKEVMKELDSHMKTAQQ